MLLYTLKRLAALVLTFIVITTLAFFIIRQMPGSVYDDPNLSATAYLVLAEHYGQEKPVLVQLADYLRRVVLHADFGVSQIIEPGVPVFNVIKNRLPVTVAVNGLALVIALPVGTLLGAASALRRKRLSGRFLVLASVICVSVPSFVIAALLQYVFAYRLNIAPILYMPGAGFGARASSIALPVAALALAPAAYITRLLRAELIEAQNADFMLFARVKGLTRLRSVFSHGLKYASIPLIPAVFLMFTDVLAGSLVAERIFSVPGMGGVLIDSISAKDHGLTMALLIFYTVVELTALFLADIALCIADPRIRIR